MNKSLERLGLSYAAKGTLSRELEEFIDAFAPDVLFTTLGDIANVRLSRAITDRFSIPIAVHLNDDWMADQYSVGPYSLIMRRRLDEELKALLERAAQRWTVSDMMSEAMGTRYGVPFETLPASVNCAQWRCARQEPIDKRVLTVVYAGTIFEFAQKSSLQDVSDAVAQLNDQGLAAQLRIYAPAAHMADYPSYFKAASTRVVPYRSRDELLRLINGADLLVIPVNFDSESRRFIGYSMPGKVSAYMATGIPILVYGPPDVPPVHEAVSYQYACVVQERDPDALRSALLTMLTDRELRSRFSSVALGRAADFYDESIVCENFRQALARICRPASCV
jgi:glycosyltransferase involved in cell wall biosynthesis